MSASTATVTSRNNKPTVSLMRKLSRGFMENAMLVASLFVVFNALKALLIYVAICVTNSESAESQMEQVAAALVKAFLIVAVSGIYQWIKWAWFTPPAE